MVGYTIKSAHPTKTGCRRTSYYETIYLPLGLLEAVDAFRTHGAFHINWVHLRFQRTATTEPTFCHHEWNLKGVILLIGAEVLVIPKDEGRIPASMMDEEAYIGLQLTRRVIEPGFWDSNGSRVSRTAMLEKGS